MASSGMAMKWVPPFRRPATASTSLLGRSPMALTPQRPASSSPPVSRAQVATNWRKGAPPPPQRPECILGRVVQLPEKAGIPATSIVHQAMLGRGNPWNHPVIITGISEDPSGEQLVKFRLCTSFGGQGIAAKKQYHHHYYVVADHSTLDSGKFSKGDKTFVNCSPGHEFEIEFKYLQFWAGVIQFSQEALASFNRNEPLPRSRRDSTCGSDEGYGSSGCYTPYGSY